jgi:hypothetical protein
MRVMNVPLFARKLEIVNLEELYRTRLNQRNDCRAAYDKATLFGPGSRAHLNNRRQRCAGRSGVR